MDRRNFLKTFSRNEAKKIRPPFWSDNSNFEEICIGCEGFCSLSCEQNIIFMDKYKTPIVDFSKNGCTYCNDCVNACPSEVLSLENKKNINAVVYIDQNKCLSWNKTMCFSCKDPCIDNAIDFTGMFSPKINEKCTSCGFCIKVCPTDAIQIHAI